MLKVGLTGGIGSGKSTISAFLKGKSISVIDADKISREVLVIYPELKKNIRNEFGDEFFDESGELKRREFGNYIFAYKEKRKKLEELILPYIKKDINKRLLFHEKLGEKICVVDAPILIESGLSEDMDINILVWVDEETQLKRVMQRDNMTEEQVVSRIKSQMSLDNKKKFVDFIIDNSKSFENSEKQLDRIIMSLETI